jgi:hypothetical protein
VHHAYELEPSRRPSTHRHLGFVFPRRIVRRGDGACSSASRPRHPSAPASGRERRAPRKCSSYRRESRTGIIEMLQNPKLWLLLFRYRENEGSDSGSDTLSWLGIVRSASGAVPGRVCGCWCFWELRLMRERAPGENDRILPEELHFHLRLSYLALTQVSPYLLPADPLADYLSSA